MKNILVTYESMIWTGFNWEPGEAATKLEFIDDDTVDDLIKSVSMSRAQMDQVTCLRKAALEKVIHNIELLRRRSYVEDSIKSIEIVSEGGT